MSRQFLLVRGRASGVARARIRCVVRRVVTPPVLVGQGERTPDSFGGLAGVWRRSATFAATREPIARINPGLANARAFAGATPGG
jgi:hypothetical protein